MEVRVKANVSKGYTLIELLITLSIIFIISHVTIRQINISYEQQTFDHFIDQLQRDIFTLQQKTITEREIYSLYFNTKEHYYVIYRSPLDPEMTRRSYSANIHLNFTTLSNPIRFQTSGNIISPGQMIATYKGENYNIIFPLGKGRFYVQKQ